MVDHVVTACLLHPYDVACSLMLLLPLDMPGPRCQLPTALQLMQPVLQVMQWVLQLMQSVLQAAVAL